MSTEDEGKGHLARISRIQFGLLALGSCAWPFRSWRAGVGFLAGGVVSILFWHFHQWVVSGMLTPSVRRRWLYGSLVLAKLALLVLLLRGMIVCFPTEVFPVVTGILLFSASIVLEGFWLVFRPD